MSTAGVRSFEASVEEAAGWIDEVTEHLHASDREEGYAALRATLQTLRGHLTIDQAARLGGQVPMIIQGMLWEGWDPKTSSTREKRRGAFAADLREALGGRKDLDPGQAARAVVAVLAKRIPPREMRFVLAVLPGDLSGMRPSENDGMEEAGVPTPDIVRVKPPEAAVEEGFCAMCGRQPAVHLGLICQTCADAVENSEPWTLEYEEILAQLRDLEEEEQYRP